MFAQLVQQARILARIGDDGDVTVVLRRRPYECRTTDVDEVDTRLARERVQIDDDERNRHDAVRTEIGAVLGEVGVGEDAAVHLRVQGDDTVAEDRRVPGFARHIDDGDTCIRKSTCGPPARQQFPAEFLQTACQFDDSRLVVRTEQRAGHARTVDAHLPPTTRRDSTVNEKFIRG